MSLTEELSAFVRDSHPETESFDNISVSSPVLGELKKNAKEVTGENITFDAILDETGRTQSGGRGYVIELQESDIIDQCSIPIIDVLQPIHLSQNTITKNLAGKREKTGAKWLADYMNGHIGAAERELGQRLGRGLYSNGATISNANAKPLPQFTGMAAICSKDSTYAGIAPTNAPSWQPAVINVTTGTFYGVTYTGSAPTVDKLMTATEYDYYLPILLDTIIDDCKYGDSEISFVTASPFWFRFIHQILVAKTQVQVTKNELGFKTFMYKETPIVMDKLSPDNVISFWSMKDMRYGYVPGLSGKVGKFTKIEPTDFIVGDLKYSGNIWTPQRRMCGQIQGLPSAITAS